MSQQETCLVLKFEIIRIAPSRQVALNRGDQVEGGAHGRPLHSHFPLEMDENSNVMNSSVDTDDEELETLKAEAMSFGGATAKSVAKTAVEKSSATGRVQAARLRSLRNEVMTLRQDNEQLTRDNLVLQQEVAVRQTHTCPHPPSRMVSVMVGLLLGLVGGFAAAKFVANQEMK